MPGKDKLDVAGELGPISNPKKKDIYTYRLSTYLKPEFKEYLKMEAWKRGPDYSITMYLNDLIQADMDSKKSKGACDS